MTSRSWRWGPALRRFPAVLVLAAIVALALRPLFRPPEVAAPVAAPGPGTVARVPPDRVELAFPSPVRDGQAHVAVTDSGGRRIGGPARVEAGDTALRLMLPPLTDGWYVVTYHVPLADGTDVSGGYPFGVGDPTGPPPGTARTATAASHTAHSGPIDPVTGVLLAVNVLLTVVLGARLVRHHRRSA